MLRILAIKQRTIDPGRKYSIRESAWLMGVHRATIYKWLKRFPQHFTPLRTDDGAHQLLDGSQLLYFSKYAIPRKGRKRQTSLQPA